MKHPTVKKIAYRALCVGTFVLRASAEQQALFEPESLQQNSKFAGDLSAWASNEGLDAHFSLIERTLISQPFGNWEESEILSGGWKSEACYVLLWSISNIDTIVPYDEQFSLSLASQINLFQPTATFLTSAELRSKNEIDAEREVAEMWFWRARTHDLMQQSQSALSRNKYLAAIKSTAEGARTDGVISELLNNDFPAFGKAYQELTDDEHGTIRSIAFERLYALNWLSGYAKDWDDVPMDT